MPCGALTLRVTDYSLTPKMFYVQEVNKFTFQQTTYFGRLVSFIKLNGTTQSLILKSQFTLGGQYNSSKNTVGLSARDSNFYLSRLI